jgi:hypothetical protein
MSNTEPFPELTPFNSSTDYQQVSEAQQRVQHRRKGSSLGGDPRGDTGAPGLASMSDKSSAANNAASSASLCDCSKLPLTCSGPQELRKVRTAIKDEARENSFSKMEDHIS